MWWWWACAGGGFPVDVVESPYAPAALRVTWTGPAGEAALLARDNVFAGWTVVRGGSVADGETTWPLGLWPAGASVAYRVEIDTGVEILRSAVGHAAVPEAPESLGRPHLVFADVARSEVSAGFVITQRYSPGASPDDAAAVVLNGDGQPVWWTAPPGDGRRLIRARPSLDGHSLLLMWDHEDPSLRRIDRARLDGSAVTETIAPGATHDFWENPDGTFTFVAYDYRTDVHLVGANPAVADALRTVAEGTTDPELVEGGFAFFDDYPVAPWFPCGHAALGFFVPGANEWTHVNSLVRAPDDDGWWMSARHLDAIVAVGDDGAFRWQAGGRDGTLAGAAAFEHGHLSHAFGDRVLVFDNGDHSPRPVVSRVVELRIDAEAGTWEEVWELPDPRAEFTSFLGDARRLPGGNTLVAWTDRGTLAEYEPDGEEVWRMDSTERYGRATWVEGLAP